MKYTCPECHNHTEFKVYRGEEGGVELAKSLERLPAVCTVCGANVKLVYKFKYTY